MKKTYINPTLVVVRMNPVSVIMASQNMILDGTQTLDDGEILVKGSGSSDVNVWDDEW